MPPDPILLIHAVIAVIGICCGIEILRKHHQTKKHYARQTQNPNQVRK